jgi:hypothetical protein
MLTINIRLMSVLKQVLGVDVARKELVVTLGRLLADLSIELYAADSGFKCNFVV